MWSTGRGRRGPLPRDQEVTNVCQVLSPAGQRVGDTCLSMPSTSHELPHIILSPPPQDPITKVIPSLQMRKLRSHGNGATAQIILTPASDLLTPHVTGIL